MLKSTDVSCDSFYQENWLPIYKYSTVIHTNKLSMGFPLLLSICRQQRLFWDSLLTLTVGIKASAWKRRYYKSLGLCSSTQTKDMSNYWQHLGIQGLINNFGSDCTHFNTMRYNFRDSVQQKWIKKGDGQRYFYLFILTGVLLTKWRYASPEMRWYFVAGRITQTGVTKHHNPPKANCISPKPL